MLEMLTQTHRLDPQPGASHQALHRSIRDVVFRRFVVEWSLDDTNARASRPHPLLGAGTPSLAGQNSDS